MLTLLASSTEFIFIPVSAVGVGGPVDPTSDPVQFAFASAATIPASNQFVGGSWFSPVANTFYAQCLIGPGGAITLTPGVYTIWVKITDSPEVPVRTPGLLQIQ